MTRSELFLVVAVVVAVWLGVATVAVFGQETYTVDQVKALILQRGVGWAAGWIASVYNGTPEVTMPSLTGEAKGADFVVKLGGPVVVDLTTVDSKHLRWNLEAGPWTFRGSVPQIDYWKLAEAAGLGFLAGLIVGGVVDHVFLK